MKEKLSKPLTIAFVALFAVLGLIALHVPMFALAGSSTKFTLYDLFAPVATGFIGTIPGLVAIFLTQLANFFITGSIHLNAITVARFLTPLAAGLYFSRYRMLSLIIPFVAMVFFWSHPVGQAVWYYALYWVIPFIAYPFSEKWLPARALGATFTAHAMGGLLYISFLNLPKSVWISLVPIVATERIAFAAGITLSYLIFNNVLAYIAAGKYPQLNKYVEKRFVWRMR